MATQMELARKGTVTEEMRSVAREEGIDPEKLRRLVASGRVVIPRNVRRENLTSVKGIGEGLSVKVNANVGTSPDLCDPDLEVEKAKVAVKYGADTVMDLSTWGDLDLIRRRIIEAVPVPVGTVPIYQAAIESVHKRGAIVFMTEDDMFNVIEKHAKDGVDFMTVHCGVVKYIVEKLRERPRVTGIVSRGGTFHAAWIIHNEKENPLYENFDYLLEIAKEYDVTLSLGDGFRPGGIADSTDWFQIQELLVIGELVKRCRKAGVQCMVEGPGHIRLDQVEANVRLAKVVCDGAPFYVLGPLVTDIAPGYDHIVSAIGGAIAAMAGADFLCYLTPSEHLGLPLVEDVKEGVIAARIAAHAANIVRLGGKYEEWDRKMDEARRALDWAEQFSLAIDPERAKKIYKRVNPSSGSCSMCGKWCVFKILDEYLAKAK